MIDMHITLIASLVSGDHLDAIPWDLETALRVVEAKTAGAFVLMGRHTQNVIEACLGKLSSDKADHTNCHCLRYSTNVVLSSLDDFNCPGCIQAFSADDALQMAARREMGHVYVIGGARIYKQFMPFARDLFAVQTLESRRNPEMPRSFGPFQSVARATQIHEEAGRLFRFVELARSR
jgi:dihydrofolate reductase